MKKNFEKFERSIIKDIMISENLNSVKGGYGGPTSPMKTSMVVGNSDMADTMNV